MSSPSVSISNAVEGVCFLCGNEGPIFEASTSCGRFTSVPLCGKDLFAIVNALNRPISTAARGAARSRPKLVPKNRSADTEDNPSSADAVTDAGGPASSDAAA